MKILNIGCGDSDYGTDFVDLYPQRSNIIKYDADVDTLPYPDATFDEVVNNYMLEHLKDRKLFLSEVRRVLKPGGVLKLETDNAGFLLYHNSKSRYMTHYGGYSFHGDDDKHYSLFTTSHIELLLKEAGFTDISVEMFNRDRFSKPIEFFLWLVRLTRFEWTTYGQLKAKCENGKS